MRRQNTFTKGEIATGKHFLVCCDGSDLSLRGVLLAAYLMGERDRIKVITVDMPAPPPPDTVEESVAVGMVGKRTANEVLTDARLILTKCGVLQSRAISVHAPGWFCLPQLAHQRFFGLPGRP